jgi:hypothetical protein
MKRWREGINCSRLGLFSSDADSAKCGRGQAALQIKGNDSGI